MKFNPTNLKILSGLLSPLNNVQYNKMFSDTKCNFCSIQNDYLDNKPSKKFPVYTKS